MGFQDKNDCGTTVTATLTNVGKMLLLTDPSKFDVSYFVPKDVGVDYSLFNPDHPDGDQYYDTAIVNLTNLEPHGDATVHNLGSNLIMNLPPDLVNLPVLSTIPDFGATMLLDKLGKYKDFALQAEYLDTQNLTVKVTVTNPKLINLEVISPHTVEPILHNPNTNAEINTSLQLQHIKIVEFNTSFNATFRVTSLYNDVGTSTADFQDAEIIFQENSLGIEYRLPIRVNYNREIDLGDVQAVAGGQ